MASPKHYDLMQAVLPYFYNISPDLAGVVLFDFFTPLDNSNNAYVNPLKKHQLQKIKSCFQKVRVVGDHHNSRLVPFAYLDCYLRLRASHLYHELIMRYGAVIDFSEASKCGFRNTTYFSVCADCRAGETNLSKRHGSTCRRNFHHIKV